MERPCSSSAPRALWDRNMINASLSSSPFSRVSLSSGSSSASFVSVSFLPSSARFSSTSSPSVSSRPSPFLPPGRCRSSASSVSSSSSRSSSASSSASSSSVSFTLSSSYSSASCCPVKSKEVFTVSRISFCLVLFISLATQRASASWSRHTGAQAPSAGRFAPPASFHFSPVLSTLPRLPSLATPAFALAPARDVPVLCPSSPVSPTAAPFALFPCAFSSLSEGWSCCSSRRTRAPSRLRAVSPLFAFPHFATWPGVCTPQDRHQVRPASPFPGATSRPVSLFSAHCAEHSPTRALRRSQRGREGENEEREKNLATERRQDVKAVDGREQSGTLKNTHKKARRKDAEEEPEETEEGEEERKEAEEEEDEEGEEMDEEDEEKDEGESEREKAGGDEREDEGRRFRPTKALRNVLSEESVDFETLEKEAAAGQGGVHHAWEIDYSDLDPSGPFQQDFLKAHYRRNFRLHADDCGSEGFQVASLTARINYLTQHMIRHRKDLSCVRGLRALVVRRRKHLQYLARKKPEIYLHVLHALNLKPVVVPGTAAKFDKRLQYACFRSVKRGPKLKARRERERRLATAALEERQRKREDAASEVTRAFAASLKVARSHAALLEHTGAAPEPSEDRDDLRADGND